MSRQLPATSYEFEMRSSPLLDHVDVGDAIASVSGWQLVAGSWWVASLTVLLGPIQALLTTFAYLPT